MDETTFHALSARVVDAVRAALDALDPDVVEAVLEADVLKIQFGAGGTPFVLNKQRPIREVWLAADRRAWHFRYDGARWICKKSGDELYETLSACLTERAGTPIRVAPPPG